MITNQEELISIIVPVYNVEKYLFQCVNSILDQTYCNIEVLLIDDGSTDSSAMICDQLSKLDSRVIVYHKDNGGLSDARNFGLNHANGAFYCFVDSDDWIHPEMIFDLHKLLISNNADIACSGLVLVFRNKELNMAELPGVFTKQEALQNLFDNINLHDHVCTKLFKAALWNNISFPINYVYEDIRTTYKVFLNTETIVVTDRNYYYYRQRGNAISRGVFNIARLQQIDAINDLIIYATSIGNLNYVHALQQRLLRVKCYILRDILLKSSKDDFNSLKNVINQLKRSIMTNASSIIFDKYAEKSIKVLAVSSFVNTRLLGSIYRLNVIRRYYLSKYIYFD